jgi:hypothetical protein
MGGRLNTAYHARFRTGRIPPIAPSDADRQNLHKRRPQCNAAIEVSVAAANRGSLPEMAVRLQSDFVCYWIETSNRSASISAQSDPLVSGAPRPRTHADELE